MDISGRIKKIDETKEYGPNAFKKREVVITTDEQYPQHILIEFVQDKCELLDSFEVGQDVKIACNLRGREWINPEGEAKYFNSLSGWRIELTQATVSTPPPAAPPEDIQSVKSPSEEEELDNLPF